jgi:hypothetical protein
MLAVSTGLVGCVVEHGWGRGMCQEGSTVCVCQFHFPIFCLCLVVWQPCVTCGRSRALFPRHVPGTGTFGRVRLVLHKESRKYMALKILKKSEVRGTLD